jgi:galactokinase
LQALFSLPFDQTALALAAQRAENDFVGCAGGIMDQLISATAQANGALTLEMKPNRLVTTMKVVFHAAPTAKTSLDIQHSQ